MKQIFTLIALVTGCNVSAQFGIYENFESPWDAYRANFIIDTVNCSHNLWQIGKPQKTVFDSALSVPNAIVTDTLNPYPPNDTSIFYLQQRGSYGGIASISFYYQLDIDSLSVARVDISGDMGLNWIDPIKEDTTYMFSWWISKPRLDTSTAGWQRFCLNMDSWSHAYPGGPWSFPHYRTSDTLLYRFTFISGDSSVTRDGWMMDNFVCENTLTVGIDNILSISSNISPNPCTGSIRLYPDFKMAPGDHIAVYNMQGQEVYNTQPLEGQTINLPLPQGVYTVRYYGSFGVATDRLVIVR